MKNFFDILKGAAKLYTPIDSAIFKILVVAIILLICCYCHFLRTNYIVVIWVVAVVCGVYSLVKTLLYANKKN